VKSLNRISALAASDRCIYILGFAEYIILYVADEFMTKPIGIETIVSHIACDKDTFCSSRKAIPFIDRN
jgi:hypothetical protein